METASHPFDLDHSADMTLRTNKIQISKENSDGQPEQFFCVLSRHYKFFPTNECQYGTTSTVQNAIHIDGSTPIRMPPYRTASAARDEIRKKVGEMLVCVVIEESNSHLAAPVVLLKRKDGRLSFCVDYSWLNIVTIKPRRGVLCVIT